MKDKLIQFFSKKLLALILLPVVMAINAKIGSPLTEDNIKELVQAICYYIAGQSIVDVTLVAKGKK